MKPGMTADTDPALSCQSGVLTGMTTMMTIPNGAAPGDVLELTVGEAAHGGWCVARSGAPGDQGQVVFVRHALPGDPAGLGWRTRVGFAVGPDGTAGLRRHRSREVIAVTDCLIAHPLVRAADVTGRRWPGARGVDVAVSPGSGERSVAVSGTARREGASLRPWLTQHAAGRTWRVSAGVFWQVHPAAAGVLTEVVLAALRPQPGDAGLDLYCGAGLFAGALAEAVGPAGLVTGVEADAAAVRDARKNLARYPQVRVHRGDAVPVLRRRGLGRASLAVLDPPRAGVDRRVIDILAGLRRIAYVSCDPATLARDLGVFAGLGWRLDGLRAFDVFPMTHHVECVAALAPS
jgi:tRNA/tmRNA/rRNA uracil-C5-methylase (TrmA/RlmC/RlmD family)